MVASESQAGLIGSEARLETRPMASITRSIATTLLGAEMMPFWQKFGKSINATDAHKKANRRYRAVFAFVGLHCFACSQKHTRFDI